MWYKSSLLSIRYLVLCRSNYGRVRSWPLFSCQRKVLKTSSKVTKNTSNIKNRELPTSETLNFRSLIKSTTFAFLFSAASFTGATIWQYENMRHRAQGFINSPKNWILNRLGPNAWIQEKFGDENVKRKQEKLKRLWNTWWNSLSEGEKIYVPIAFLNVLVFIAWKIPSWNRLMIRYFCSTPSCESICWSMFLSTFSHCSGVHLVVNMFVLYSFITSIVSVLGKEQFIAFYCSAGVFSSLGSNLYKVIICQKTVSVGASGAIMAVLGYICTKYPETLLSIVFFPMLVFKAGWGLKFIMGVDCVGLLLRWKVFDHAAHLGGVLFGLFWCYWGNIYIWQNRGPILEWWHKLRTSR